MIQKKICMLGAFAVGKTSLVRRFVQSIYDEKYHSTLGVKVDRKDVRVDDTEVGLILWDIHGHDEFQKIRESYLRGAAGCLLVVDGTRPQTLPVAGEIAALIERVLGDVPVVVAVNKCDLRLEWDSSPQAESYFAEKKWPVLHASAKTGEGVEEAFRLLASKSLGR